MSALSQTRLEKHAGEPASGGFARWKHVVLHYRYFPTDVIS
ncbi:hypothetical protein HTIA_1055 [Halorhabdus tiamatea SARL4B]|uniref:Uncharacterized protein n=1 Tax=Halorhabdus tiamatea SARL4B TaxID=1033806 RepID=S6D056_9EURY|nr:hypothetical protein HTIA_1055 [Halorhabdus tiamatea SARL4B]